MSDFVDQREVRARKRHRCGEAGCAREIRPGDLYSRIAGVLEGEFYSAKLCARCRRLHGKAWRRYGKELAHDEGPALGGLLEWIRESRR